MASGTPEYDRVLVRQVLVVWGSPIVVLNVTLRSLTENADAKLWTVAGKLFSISD